MSARPGPRGGYRVSGIPTAISEPRQTLLRAKINSASRPVKPEQATNARPEARAVGDQSSARWRW
jgi:hypothetical protein